MNRIIGIYNRNRKLIWIIIVIIALIILILNILNKNAIKTSDQKQETPIDTNTSYSVISQTTIKQEIADQNSNIIKSFINYCNNGEIENAYNILSDECKNKIYPSLEQFETRYYNRIFTDKKNYEIQLWVTTENYLTYKISFIEDMLSTGNSNSSKIQDYYTINTANNKLNINGYVGNIPINKTTKNEYLEICVLSKDIYMDYEVLNINAVNCTSKWILLDGRETTNSMYVQDENGLKYIAYLHELVDEQLRVSTKKDISIKFNKKYGTKGISQKLILSNIILDSDEYMTYENKEEYKNKLNTVIDLY